MPGWRVRGQRLELPTRRLLTAPLALFSVVRSTSKHWTERIRPSSGSSSPCPVGRSSFVLVMLRSSCFVHPADPLPCSGPAADHRRDQTGPVRGKLGASHLLCWVSPVLILSLTSCCPRSRTDGTTRLVRQSHARPRLPSPQPAWRSQHGQRLYANMLLRRSSFLSPCPLSYPVALSLLTAFSLASSPNARERSPILASSLRR